MGPRVYVRDSGVKGTLDIHASLPPDARDTGYRAGSVHLFISPSDQDQYVYLVDTDRIERWPRVDPFHGCV